MNTIQEIIQLAHNYARARGKLIGRCSLIQRAINRLKSENLETLRKYADATGASYTALAAAIDQSRDLFASPKTLEIDGIKFGLRKAKGKMTWDDEEAVIRRIKMLPDHEAMGLLRVKEAPDKAALERLPAAILKRLGVAIHEDSDAVLITSPESEVEKLAAAFLQEEPK
jgi:hypothetical protein